MTNTPQIQTLYDAATIARRVDALAEAIAATAAPDLLVVAVLRGSFIFAADLVRALHRAGMSPAIEFMQLASYHEGQVSSGVVTVTKDIESPVKGRDVLLIDDILETGRTLTYAKDLLAARGAARVMSVVLIEKPGKRAVQLHPDFVGFTAPDRFLVGYGMDVAHKYRELPYIGEVVQNNERS